MWNYNLDGTILTKGRNMIDTGITKLDAGVCLRYMGVYVFITKLDAGVSVFVRWVYRDIDFDNQKMNWDLIH